MTSFCTALGRIGMRSDYFIPGEALLDTTVLVREKSEHEDVELPLLYRKSAGIGVDGKPPWTPSFSILPFSVRTTTPLRIEPFSEV
jgi:hypothetical protein